MAQSHQVRLSRLLNVSSHCVGKEICSIQLVVLSRVLNVGLDWQRWRWLESRDMKDVRLQALKEDGNLYMRRHCISSVPAMDCI